MKPVRNTLLTNAIEITDNGIISKKILSADNGNITLFSFDKKQSLNDHSTPYAVFLMALEGEASFEIGKDKFTFVQGEFLTLEPNESHAMEALTDFKMLMVLLKKKK